jgi:hypothetical protein
VAANRLGNKLDLSPPPCFSAPSPAWRAAGQLLLAAGSTNHLQKTALRYPYLLLLAAHSTRPLPDGISVGSDAAQDASRDLEVASSLQNVQDQI